MSGFKINVHHQYVPDWGPASNFVPPTVQMQERGDSGGSQPTEPKALVFVDPDGESHVFLVSEKMRQQLLRMLTGGVIVAGGGDIIGGGM